MFQTTIALEGIQCDAKIGYYDFEQERGNHFLIDMTAVLNTSPEEEFTDLDKTLNYEWMHRLVLDEMKIPCRLMEETAARIMKKARANTEGPEIVEIHLVIRKKNPPLRSPVQFSRVEMHWKK